MPKPKFKNTKLYEALVQMAVFVGLSEPPIVDGKVVFDESAKEKLNKVLKEGQLDKTIEAANKDLEESNQTDQITARLQDVLAQLEIPQEDLEAIVADAKGKGNKDPLAMIQAVEAGITTFQANQKKIIDKLSNEPEPDNPIDIIKQTNMQKIIHSATHLFASTKAYDAIDNERPWNKAAAAGLTVSATDYNDGVTINKLNGDAELYFRENPTEIQSLHRDNFGLPTWWKKVFNVSDRRSSASILTAEITQGRKLNWLPKNIQEIEAEEGKIYPVQIDAEWEGFQLQEIETSWLNMLNKEGSQPEKMSFVRFLVGELLKRARVEDRISTLNGIFVQTPAGATVPGRFINRQNGIFFQLWKARDIDQKYRPFTGMGEITPANVYDYFHSDDEANLGFLKRFPQEVLAQTNLVVNIHYKVWTWYKAKYKEINGTNMDFKGLPDHFEDYPNVMVETYVDQENPSFVWATFTDNVEILENVVTEKSTYKFQTLLRKIYLLADYKLGVRLIHIGRKIKAGDPAEFKVQSVWSNDAPVFLDEKFIPVYDDATGIVKVDYKNIQVVENWATAITEFSGVKPGQVIKIRGNTALAANVNVTDGAKISLTGDAAFNLKTGGTLTLFVKSDYTLVELNRTITVPTNPSTDVSFTGTTIDANDGSVFLFAGGADATLTDIDNGVNNQIIRIYGNDTADVDLTVANVTGLISVGTSVVLSAADKYLELVKVDGVWYKGNTNV